jgi:hypothetical protein
MDAAIHSKVYLTPAVGTLPLLSLLEALPPLKLLRCAGAQHAAI